MPHIFITDIQPKIPLDRAMHAPTALDIRNTGPALELSGTMKDGDALELTASASLVWLAAMEPVIGARENRISRPSIEQPRFRFLRTQTKLLVQQETHRLLAVFTEGRTPPRAIFFLLHVRVQPAPPPL